MIADWTTVNTLTTPAGNLTLNGSSGNQYMLINDACSGAASPRITSDNIPQSDGQLNHPQYLTGYRMSLAVALWVDGEVACGGDAQEMLDELGAHIDALRNPETTTRIIWTPEGMASRMINDISLAGEYVTRVAPRGDEAGIVTVTFSVCSEFPYEMSEAERTPTTLTPGTGLGSTFTNNGNTCFWPVFKVYGPESYFELHNLTTGKVLVYNSLLNPGGIFIGTGEYVEIDMFRGTVVINGDEDDSAISGIDFTQTEFWCLEPGDNDLALIGGTTATVLWNDSWI